MLTALALVVVVAGWLGWLGWHALDGGGAYPATCIVGMVVTVAATQAVAVRRGLRPLATVNAATVAMVAVCWSDVFTTSGDGNFFVSLLLFGSPLYVLALTVALPVEAQQQRWRPPPPPPPHYRPGPLDSDQ